MDRDRYDFVGSRVEASWDERSEALELATREEDDEEAEEEEEEEAES